MKKLIALLILFSMIAFADQKNSLFIKLNNYKTIEDALNKTLLKGVKNSNDFDFFLTKAKKGLTNTSYYHYNYKYKNILVDNETVVISVKNNKPFLLTGNFYIPTIDSLEFKNTEIEVFKKFKNSTKALKFHSDIQKVIIIKNNQTYLAYKALVEYTNNKGYHLGVIYLDASNSNKLLFRSHIYQALNRKVYNFNYQCLDTEYSYNSLPGTLSINEGGSLGNDVMINDAYSNLGVTYWFYKNMFNRDSFDNNGINLVSTVHATFDLGYGCEGGNAFFMGEPYDQMVYGDGDGTTLGYLSKALDVTAHELTHAVTDRESGLYYYGQSGALNEAMSDIFGATTEAWRDSGGNSVSNPSNFVANSNTWKIGEEVMLQEDAMRYMNNPRLASGPDEYNPDHYSNRYLGYEDEAGVHINSTIISLSYYLLVQGGSHPRLSQTLPAVQGIGLEKAIKIYYEAQTGLFTSSQSFDFSDARTLLSQAAENLYGDCSNESEQVNRAFDIVGVPGNRRAECSNITSCDGITCDNHGTCELVNGYATCNCDTGYTVSGLSCTLDSTGVCSGVDCNAYYPNTYCLEYQGQAACDCLDGYVWNSNQTACVQETTDVCNGIDCSLYYPNTHCVESQGQASCDCDEGYILNQAQDACIEDVVVDPCEGITCSGHGTCISTNGVASCNCDDGYTSDSSLHCIEDVVVDHCEGITCSGHGTCISTNGVASCDCDDGYTSDSSLHCIQDVVVDPCENYDCSDYQNTHCIVYQNRPACECDEDFHLNEEKTLCIEDAVINLCEGITCSSHGICTDQNNQASCICDEGYISDNNLHCVEDISSLCSDITCSNHGLCAVVNTNTETCVCDAGYYADGTNCILNNTKTVNSSSCNYSNSGNNQILLIMLLLLALIILRRKQFNK